MGASRDDLITALKAADAAGDTAGAQSLAAAITNYSSDNNYNIPAPATPAAPPPAAAGVSPDTPMWQKMLQPVADAGRLIGNGATLGGYDKLMGAIAPSIGGSDTAGQRAITDAARARGGQGGSVLELGSSLLPAALTDGATALPAMGNGLTKALAVLGIGGAEGAGYSGIQASNEDKPVLPAMAKGLAFGAGGQAAAGALSKLGSKIGGLFSSKPPRMTVPELSAAKNRAYQAVDNAGVEYTPGTIRGMLSDMDAAAPAYPARHDQVIAAKNQINANIGTVPRPIALPEVDMNRQIIERDLNSLPDRAQQGMGLDMTKAMDDNLAQVSPLGVTARSGDPAEGLDLMNQARGLNSRMRKLEDMTAVEDKSQLQANKSLSTGFDSTIKNNVTGILTNPKRMNGYTPDEEAAMREVVNGTPGTNAARQAGRLAPGGGLSWAGASAAGGLAGLLSGGNPMVATAAALAPPAIGMVSKKLSEMGTRKSANNLMDLVAAGGAKAPSAPALDPQTRDKLGRFMMMMQMQGQ